MVHPPFEILHVGHGPGLTLFEYLYRVLLHLLALGGIAALVLRLVDVVGAIRSPSASRDASGEPDVRDS